MAFDVRLTNPQGLALLDLIGWLEVNEIGCDSSAWWDGHDGHAFRVLRNAAIRLSASMAADLPDGKHTAKLRGMILRELIKQLRDGADG